VQSRTHKDFIETQLLLHFLSMLRHHTRVSTFMLLLLLLLSVQFVQL